MLKTVKNYIIAIILASCFNTTQAHIFNVQKLVKGSHSVVLLSDFHSELNAEKERNTIVQCAKACGGALVVEDSSIPLGHDVKKQIDGSLCQLTLDASRINHYQSICVCPTTVFMLYSAAAHNGVTASNIEFRFDDHLTLREIFNVIQKKKEKFVQLSETAPYGNYYKSCLEYLKTNIEEPCSALFQSLANTDLTLTDAFKAQLLRATDSDVIQATKVKADRNFKAVITEKRHAVDNLYNDYCNIVLEMEMMHAIEHYSNYKTTFVCAGGAHNKQIKQVLMAHGYTMADEYGHPIPEIINPAHYDTIAQSTIDLEQVLDIVCTQNSQPGVLIKMYGYVNSIIAFCSALFS